MLLPALTLLLCLAQQTLQGGVKPQSVAYGRPLAAGVTGALGALGSRYGTKAMKTGIGRYPAAHLGTGGFRNLGLGGRGGIKPGGYGAMQGGYGARGAYGAGMGTGMGLGPGFANGLGINLGQGGKRGYGAGLGALPGYGGFGGAGYPVSRPGVSAAESGPDVAGLGQAAPDLKREKSTAVGNQFGDKDRKIGPEMPGMRRTGVLGPNPPESHSGLEVKRLDPLTRSSDLRPAAPLDTQLGILGLDVSGAHGVGPLGALVPRRKGTLGPEATPAPGGRRGQLPLSKDNIRTLGSAYSRVHSAKDFDPSIQQIPKAKNCGSPLSEVLQQKERTYRPLTKDPRGNVFSVQGQGSRDYLPSLADRQDAKGPLARNKNGPTETQGWDFALVGKERDAHGFTGEEARRLSQAERIERKPKALPIPGQAERRTQAASVSAAESGPDVAGLGQAAPDLKREKSTAVGNQFGDKDRKIGPEMPGMRRTGVLGPNPPESHSGLEVKRLDPLTRSSDLRPAAPLDTQLGILGLDVSGAHGVGPLGALVPRRKGTLGPEATPAPGGRRGQLPLSKDNIRTLGSAYSRVHSAKDFDPSIQQIPKAKNCGSPLSEVLQQKERTYRPLTKDPRGNVFSVQGQGSRDYLPSLADRQDAKGPLARNKNGPTETQGWDFALVGKERDAHGFTGEEARRLSQAERIERKPKALPIPGQAERRTQAASYLGGAGNYLGASVGTGGYGAGLGQGAYLGGAAGKHGGYGDGLTGYLGAVAGNGFGGDAGKTLSAGYGNGYGNGYGTGLDYPAELADGAEYKAGKSKALGNGGYAAPVQGAFGALGAGLESAGGKYGGAAAPAHYGNAPVIPAALEGDAGYPYAAQQLGLAAEGTKTASKYGATEGFGAQQAGFGMQLGVAQEALGQQQSKYGGVNGGLGNGYKG